MYKLESIAKVMRIAKETGSKYAAMDPKDIKLCLSTGNRKIGRVMNVSLMPIVTCHNCSECKFFCYDIKACLQYPATVIDARMRNTILCKLDRDEYFHRIDEKMSRRRKNKYFRWHVAGDILDLDYFSRMVENTRKHSDFIVWTYTKNYTVVNEYCSIHGRDAIPENFHIMFSEWDGMELVNPYGFPVFTCKLKDGNKNHKPEYFDSLYKCPGNCDACKAGSLGCVGGMDTYCDEH